MSQFTEAHNESLVQACKENAAEIAAAFNRCFEREWSLEPGESKPLDVEQLPNALDGPGLIVTIQVGTQGLLALLPASLPLPGWYDKPGQTEASRLQTLAMECSTIVLPDDLEAESFATISTANLRSALTEAEPSASSMLFELGIDAPSQEDSESTEGQSTESDGTAEAESTPTESAEADAEGGDETVTEESSETADPSSSSRAYLIWPVANLPSADDQPDAPVTAETAPPAETAAAEPTAQTPQAIPANLQRLKSLPISVTVRLAEKKIEMGQLLALTPGGMIMFTKSCEELLDLYVNNPLYCRGEAVKIGEKFGLKVNEVGVVPVREKSIIQG